jgi:hypothetical protein
MNLLWIFLIGIAAGIFAGTVPMIPFYVDLWREHREHKRRTSHS